MSQRFYIDTAIWRDYFEDRKDGIKPLGELAFQFLKQCREHNCILIYSEAVLFELKDFSNTWLEELFSPFKDLLIKVPTTTKQHEEAAQIAQERKLPFNDAFHAVIARDNDAVLISRDEHFQKLLDIVETKVPEEVIFD